MYVFLPNTHIWIKGLFKKRCSEEDSEVQKCVKYWQTLVLVVKRRSSTRTRTWDDAVNPRWSPTPNEMKRNQEVRQSDHQSCGRGPSSEPLVLLWIRFPLWKDLLSCHPNLLLCRYGRRDLLFFFPSSALKEAPFLSSLNVSSCSRLRPQVAPVLEPPSSSGSHIKSVVENEYRQ